MDDHDNGRMTDEGCPHDPPAAPATAATTGDYRDERISMEAQPSELARAFAVAILNAYDRERLPGMVLSLEVPPAPVPPSPAARGLKLRRSGVQACGCGRPISANKHACFSCATANGTAN
jgi:hypothetical protein